MAAKKLYRSLIQKMVAGVCGGLAEYFDIDVSIIRLIFIAIALASALIPMFIFYIIAWIVIPTQPTPPPKEDKAPVA
ncbi:MAG: PspC domain-containing protein [Candidatus Aminicenantes bacterium]|nr:PspC domain-containing protein [Candidatus Aminicenantes bacterium]